MKRPALVALLALIALLAGGAFSAPGSGTACPAEAVSSSYARSVDRALRSGRDLWGEELIRSAAGPTYAGVARHLEPLFFAEQRGGGLTESGAHYLAFGQPAGPFGAGALGSTSPTGVRSSGTVSTARAFVWTSAENGMGPASGDSRLLGSRPATCRCSKPPTGTA